jgi:hypothetical protein
MNTDEHRYEKHAENGRVTRRVKEGPGPKSVFIRVHPWFRNSLSGFNCVIQDHAFLCRFAVRTPAVIALTSEGRVRAATCRPLRQATCLTLLHRQTLHRTASCPSSQHATNRKRAYEEADTPGAAVALAAVSRQTALRTAADCSWPPSDSSPF